MAPSVSGAAVGGSRFPASGLRPSAKHAMSPRAIRGPPQRMVSASASLGGDRSPPGANVDGCPSPGVPIRTARGHVATAGHGAGAVLQGGYSNGNSLPSSAQAPVALQQGRSSLGSRAAGSLGACRRNFSAEHANGQSAQAPPMQKASGSVLGPSGATVVSELVEETSDSSRKGLVGLCEDPSYQPAQMALGASPLYAAAVSSSSWPAQSLWVPATTPGTAVLLPSHVWGLPGPVPPTNQSPRVMPGMAAVPPPAQDALTNSVQGCHQGYTTPKAAPAAVTGLRTPTTGHPPHANLTAPWPRSAGMAPQQISGQLTGAPSMPQLSSTPSRAAPFESTGAQTPSKICRLARSASDMPGVAPRSALSRPSTSPSPPPAADGDIRARTDRGTTAAAVAQLAKEAQDAKVEREFLRRIEALEAKVGDRDGLLAKLSRQQARLDRLELLARENEILKAQMRGEVRREQFDHRRVGATAAAAANERPASKDKPTRRIGVDRQASGRQLADPREVRIVTAGDVAAGREASSEVQILTASDVAAARREAAALPEENGDAEVGSARRPPSTRGLRVHRCSSSGTFSPPAPDRPAVVAPRRMASAPQELAPSDALKVGKQVPSSELESRLEELELALGLQPGACTKSPIKRPLRENIHAVIREQSV